MYLVLTAFMGAGEHYKRGQTIPDETVDEWMNKFSLIESHYIKYMADPKKPVASDQ